MTSSAHRLRRLKRGLLAFGLGVAAIAGTLYVKSEQIVLGAEAYIFGYPLVMMDVTRVNAGLTLGPENHLRRVRQFPDSSFKDVVRPNVDTLYTTGFIDMAKGPWVFEMAANAQRYEVMPFMDGWTNVFATPGTRTTGTAGGRFLLAGPDWQGPHARWPDPAAFADPDRLADRAHADQRRCRLPAGAPAAGWRHAALAGCMERGANRQRTRTQRPGSPHP